MKIYCARRVLYNELDVDSGEGDLKILQHLVGKDIWFCVSKSNTFKYFAKAKSFSQMGGSVLVDEICIKYYKNGLISEVELLEEYIPISRYGTLVRPIELMTEEEVNELLEQYEDADMDFDDEDF